jgi:hypothetical protein
MSVERTKKPPEGGALLGAMIDELAKRQVDL